MNRNGNLPFLFTLFLLKSLLPLLCLLCPVLRFLLLTRSNCLSCLIEPHWIEALCLNYTTVSHSEFRDPKISMNFRNYL